jgi:L-glutamine-phosphate cytidylyltransferase
MKAMILAAGLGSRLLGHTSTKPKCLVDVGGKPILQWQLEALHANSIHEVVIITGYKSDKVHEFMDAFPLATKMQISFVHNQEFNQSNSGYSGWLAREHISADYLHLNCDIVFDAKLLKVVLNSKHDNLVVVDTQIEIRPGMDQVVMQEEKMIDGNKIRKEEVNLPGANAKAVGLAKFSGQQHRWFMHWLQQKITQGDKNQNYYGGIWAALKEGREFHCLDAREYLLFEVNTVDDLHQGVEILASHSL